jgi:Cu/Ag efflux pump CusA
MQRPAGAALAIGLLGAVALAGALSFGAELLPSFRERHYVLQVSGPAGASFDWMRATGERISRGLLAIPEVLSVEEQIGRAEAGEDTWPPHRASSTSA